MNIKKIISDNDDFNDLSNEYVMIVNVINNIRETMDYNIESLMRIKVDEMSSASKLRTFIFETIRQLFLFLESTSIESNFKKKKYLLELLNDCYDFIYEGDNNVI